jgi:hypothetical protein
MGEKDRNKLDLVDGGGLVLKSIRTFLEMGWKKDPGGKWEKCDAKC